MKENGLEPIRKRKQITPGSVLGVLLSLLLLAAVAAGVVRLYPLMERGARTVSAEDRQRMLENAEYYRMLHWGGQFYGSSLADVTEEDFTPLADGTYYYTGKYIRNIVWNMESDYAIVACAAFGLVFLLGLLLPLIRPLRLGDGLKANLPLAIRVTGAGLVLAFVTEGDLPYEILRTMRRLSEENGIWEWTGMLRNVMTPESDRALLLFFHGALWFGFLLVTYLCALGIRQLFVKGPRRYLRENTVLGLLIVWAVKKCKKLGTKIAAIDFEEKGVRRILAVTAVNFVIVVLLCCVWFAGALGAILYSILVFVLLYRLWEKVRQQYAQLLAATSRMAQGQLNVVYDGAEEGIFSGLCRELEQVQQGFERAVREEAKSQRMKTELITNVSHDLKTPLTAIITYVNLLKDETLEPEKRREYVGVLEKKSARLKTLIENLFEVSKATSGTIVLNRKELDLVALVKEVQVELEDRILESGIEFRLQAPEKVKIVLDGEKTYRMFENLVNNIVKYGLAGSRAYLLIEDEGTVVRVTLKNVSAKELTFDVGEITERFVRGDASRNTEGSGLGLAIARSFAEAQGGTLAISTDGDLFKAVVELPRTEETGTNTGGEPEPTPKEEETVDRDPVGRRGETGQRAEASGQAEKTGESAKDGPEESGDGV